MKYIIHEYQTDDQGNTAIVTPEQRNDYYEAESVFYFKLAAAAISTLAKHTVELETNEGQQLLVKCYTEEEKAEMRARDRGQTDQQTEQQTEPEGGGEG